ncbi:MAG: chemotaxis protein CheW [Deltaproteobacteria bacterium]|nr:chemotaxis protein CheW [Deltaproteobacteria bacterium]
MSEESRPTPLFEALAGARPSASGPSQVPEAEFFRVRVGDTAFAVESGLIQEVVRAPPITPLPGAPAYLVGVAAHRGDVVAVVDLARLLGRGQTEVSDRSRMAVARADGVVVALLADAVLGLVRLPATALQPPPLGTEDAEFIKGVAIEPEPMHLIDLRRALATARERAIARR